MALWANLHASFPIALVLAALFGLEAVASAAPDERTRTGAKWALVLLAALAATGATPYGYDPLLGVLEDRRARRRSTPSTNGCRWASIYTASTARAFIAGSLAIVAAARAGWTRAAPLALCGALMVRHVRFFPLFAIVAAAAIATPLAYLLPRFARRPSTPGAATRKASAAGLALSLVVAAMVVMFAPKPAPPFDDDAGGSACGSRTTSLVRPRIQRLQLRGIT